jgi:hypothetical protein
MTETRSRSDSPSDSQGRSSTVRITLAHWIWWLTVTAALLAIHRNDMLMLVESSPELDSPRAARSRLISSINRAANFAAVPFFAIAIVACGSACLWRAKSIQGFPALPGHWLLVCIGAYELTHETSDLIWHYVVVPQWEDVNDLPPEAYEPLWLWMEALDATRFIAGTATAALSIALSAAAFRWRLAFWFAATMALAFLAINVLNAGGLQFFAITVWTEFTAKSMVLVTALAVGVNAILDVVSASKRDLLHWLGIIVAFASSLHSAAWDFSFWFAYSLIQS